MPRPEGNLPCDRCGHGWGAHADTGDFCPREGGGWLQTVFRFVDPGHRADHNDSVCQVCDLRRGQHYGSRLRCPGPDYARVFEPYQPTLVQFTNMPEVNYTRPVVNGTFSTEPQPAPFDFRASEHLSEFASIVNKLAGELYRRTGRKQPLRAIVLERDMMLSMGIPPDTELHTATGPVKIQCDKPLNTSDTLFGVDRTQAPQPWIARATRLLPRAWWDDVE
jgi:hypothetical protein